MAVLKKKPSSKTMDKIIKIEDRGFLIACYTTNFSLYLLQSLKDLSVDKKSSNQLP